MRKYMGIDDVSVDTFFDNSDVFTDAGNTDVDTTNANDGKQDEPTSEMNTETTSQDQPGFEGRFIKEDGQVDLNGAMEFISSNQPKYDNVEDITSTMRSPLKLSPQQTQSSTGQPAKEQWEEEFERDRTERENHFKKYFHFRDFLLQAQKEGYPDDQLLRRAEELAREEGEKEWARLQYKKQHETRAQESKRLAEERSYSELIPKSRSNLGVVYSRFKDGENGFNELVFGREIKDPTGKVIGKSIGFGSDFINYAFKLQNRGKDIPSDPTSREFKEFADKWWIEFTSDPQNLEHMIDYSMSKLHLHLQKYTAAALKKQGAAESKRLASAVSKGKPTQVQRNQPNPAQDNTFQSIASGKDFVDSV